MSTFSGVIFMNYFYVLIFLVLRQKFWSLGITAPLKINNLVLKHYIITSTSVAEPHYFYAAPGPSKILYEAPAPALLLHFESFFNS
jgi:hypothetical protein